MINSYETLLIPVFIIALAITGRLLLARLSHPSRPSTRFRIMAELFLLYTLALVLMLRQVYFYVLQMNGSIGDYHRAAIISVCSINAAVLFLAITYWAVRGKHRLSDNDKMKLMDM